MSELSKWSVTCNVCKIEHIFENKEAIPGLCPSCVDDVDKQQFKYAIAEPYEVKDGVETLGLSDQYDDYPNLALTLVLTDRNTKKTLKIVGSDLPNGECILGRDGDIEKEYFCTPDNHVSRQHCRIRYEDSKYKIAHLSNTNDTKLNNSSLGFGYLTQLNIGDVVSIADKHFNVSICESESEVHSAN